MKTTYLFFPVLLGLSAVLTGCVSAGYESSDIKTAEGRAMNKGVYLDFFGHGRQVYPAPVVASVPVYYQDGIDTSYPVYAGAFYSGSYYGRPVSNIDYSNRDTYSRGHHYDPPEHTHPPVHVPPPHVVHPPQQPHTPYVQPPYVLPPTGSVTIVRPIPRYGPSYPPYPPYSPGHP